MHKAYDFPNVREDSCHSRTFSTGVFTEFTLLRVSGFWTWQGICVFASWSCALYIFRDYVLTLAKASKLLQTPRQRSLWISSAKLLNNYKLLHASFYSEYPRQIKAINLLQLILTCRHFATFMNERYILNIHQNAIKIMRY